MLSPSSHRRGTRHAAMPAARQSTLLLLCAAALLATASAYDCDSGILQMKALPQEYDNCFYYPLGASSLKAACSWALRVRVKNNVVKIVPLVQDILNTTAGPSDTNVFDCKDVNASGLFYPGSTTSASVMLYDDFGGPLSNLTKTGAGQISLIAAHAYSSNGPLPNCMLNYTVVQGCVFGVKAPAKPAAACPVGYTQKKGRFGITYCAPCAAGTYYNKASSTCKPCAIGTYSASYGLTQCTKCDSSSNNYVNVTGATECEYCPLYDGYYTDGRSCKACPKGSYPSSDVSNQCYRCDAGKRCCTVGWTKSCPKCPAGGASPKSYSSIFALESAAPSSCLATGHALCSPKINITVDATCTISLDNLGNSNNPDANTYCSWSTTQSVNGSQLSIADIAKFDWTGNYTLLSGNFTSLASPYLTVNIPDTKCTLRYRALTAPFAKLLGGGPKPSKATSCPAGQYLETATDTKPGPCLPCPPGRYSPRASSGRQCFRCPAGTYANRYGSTGCKRCPAGLAATAGSASCSSCGGNTYPLPGGKVCKECPTDSSIDVQGGRCLANAYGSVCCAAGNCAGQPPCKGPLKSSTADISDLYTAVLQLVSKSVAQPACKNATFLSCLPANGKLQLNAFSSSPGSLSVRPYRTSRQFTCANYSRTYSGSYIGATIAQVYGFEEDVDAAIYYGLKSDSAKGTVTMYLATDATDASGAPAKASADCSAEFKLLSGYAFDLTPPKDAKCDPADAVYTYGSRKFCRACLAGEYKNSTGLCGDCPAGTFNDIEGATSCKTCRAGYSCTAGTASESTCGGGTYASKPGQAECAKCPKNTIGYESYDIPTTKCAACPKGTIAPEGAFACGLPWDKKFPA